MKFLKTTASVFLSAALTACCFAVGHFLLRSYAIVGIAAASAAAAILVAAFIVGILRDRQVRSSFKLRFGQARKHLSKRSENIESDAAKELYKLKKNILLFKVYCFSIFVLFCILAVGIGVLHILLASPVLLFAGMFLFGFFRALFKDEEEHTENFYITEENYPALYSMFCDALKKFDIKTEVRLAASAQSSVVYQSGVYVIFVDLFFLNVADEGSIRVSLTRAAARIADGDLKEAARINGFLNGFSKRLSEIFLCKYVFYVFAALNIFEFNVYEALTEKFAELRIDKSVYEKTSAKDFVNEAALFTMRSYYEFSAKAQLLSYGERAKRYTSLLSEDFKKSYMANGELWRGLAANELPALFDTVPTLKQRTDAVNSYGYELSLTSSEPILGEVEKLTESYDMFFYEEQKEFFKLYGEAYSSDMKLASEWSGNFEDSDKGISQALSAAQAIYCIEGGGERYEKLLKGIIELRPANGPALYALAEYKLRCFDSGGFGLLREAIGTRNIDTGEALELWGYAALKLGNVQELEAYRSATDIYADDVNESERKSLFSEELKKSTLPDDVAAALVKELVSLDAVETVYIVDKPNKTGSIRLFCIDGFASVSEETYMEQLYELKNFLSTFNENYVVADVRKFPLEKRKLGKVSGALFYERK